MAPTTKECIAYWRAATTCHKLPGQNPHKKKDGSHPMSRSTVVRDLEAFRREVWREEETKGDQGVARPKVGDEVYISTYDILTEGVYYLFLSKITFLT